MRTHRFCKHCGTQVRKETNLDYPFYCPDAMKICIVAKPFLNVR